MKLHRSLSAAVARILAEHPRCIAFGPNIPHEAAPAAATAEERTARGLQHDAIVAWIRSRDAALRDLTLFLGGEPDDPQYVTLHAGNDGLVCKAWLLTVTFDSLTFYVAIEAGTP